MNSAFSYFGGKARMVPYITAQFPARMDAYIEGFFGSGAVFFAAEGRWSESEIINDFNSNVTNFFEVLRDAPQKLINVLELTPHSRKEYNDAREKLDSKKQINKIERARSFFVNVEQSFGRMQKKSGWALPSVTGRNGDRAARWVAKTDRNKLLQISQRLKDASIESIDILRLLKMYDAPGVLFYLDPPYAVENKKRMQDINTSYAGFGMDEENHKCFVEHALSIRGMAIISGYDHPIYNPLVKNKWQKIQFATNTQVANTNRNKISKETRKRIETLWINPALIAAKSQLTLF